MRCQFSPVRHVVCMACKLFGINSICLSHIYSYTWLDVPYKAHRDQLATVKNVLINPLHARHSRTMARTILFCYLCQFGGIRLECNQIDASHCERLIYLKRIPISYQQLRHFPLPFIDGLFVFNPIFDALWSCIVAAYCLDHKTWAVRQKPGSDDWYKK